jgi:Ca2+-binding RTX toxin-like protein
LPSFHEPRGKIERTISNVLLWGNRDARGQVFDESGRDIATTLHDSLLEGGPQGYVKDPKGTNAFTAGFGNLALGPGPLDAAHGDARPASADSPLIDAGDTLAADALDTDLAGGPRACGAEVDIGAYESAPLAPAAGSTTITGTGTDGDDLIAVERGITRVDAGSGDDIIGNAIGRQTLIGGVGADVFRYGDLSERGDIIEGFEPDRDRIDVRSLLAKLGYKGSNPLADGYLSMRASGADTAVYLGSGRRGPGASHAAGSATRHRHQPGHGGELHPRALKDPTNASPSARRWGACLHSSIQIPEEPRP